MGNWASPEALLTARTTLDAYNAVLETLVAEFNGPAHAGSRGFATAFVIQPFAKDATFGLNLVSYDCFHPSASGQALLAQGLWNNLMQPAGAKATVSESDDILCPTPYTLVS